MDIEKGILHVQLDEEDRYVALFLMERSQWLDKFIDDIQMSSTISLVWERDPFCFTYQDHKSMNLKSNP
jgi:hypothetical protein